MRLKITTTKPKVTLMMGIDADLASGNNAIYLPAVNEGYAAIANKPLPTDRPFPAGLTLADLVFWEPNALWYYPYLLHSIGLYSAGTLPDNAVTQRNRSNNTLVGDSGGFQIGKGTMQGLKALQPKPMPATAAVQAWREEFDARQWIVGWLDLHANYAMTIDMPLWATTPDGKNSPFHCCSEQQLINMTVDNLKFISTRATGRAKWLNVVQGGLDQSQTQRWWEAVKWFRKGGWAMAGSAGAKGGIANMLRAMLMMRDDNAFESGQDWIHVLGISTPKWAVLLSAVQRALQVINPKLRISFDSSSPFQTGGRYEDVALTPAFTFNASTWGISTQTAPQSRLHADASSAAHFPHDQSPLGSRMLLNHLSVKGDIWDHRNFDTISNMLLVNHNVWVYLNAFSTANALASARDKDRVPAMYLECLDFIADVFQRSTWSTQIDKERKLLDAVAPTGYKTP
jgi:hypothetical protein